MTAYLTRRHLLAAAGAASVSLAAPGLLRAAPAAWHVTGTAFASYDPTAAATISVAAE